jgi:hypothetical protein
VPCFLNFVCYMEDRCIRMADDRCGLTKTAGGRSAACPYRAHPPLAPAPPNHVLATKRPSCQVRAGTEVCKRIREPEPVTSAQTIRPGRSPEIGSLAAERTRAALSKLGDYPGEDPPHGWLSRFRRAPSARSADGRAPAFSPAGSASGIHDPRRLDASRKDPACTEAIQRPAHAFTQGL